MGFSQTSVPTPTRTTNITPTTPAVATPARPYQAQPYTAPTVAPPPVDPSGINGAFPGGGPSAAGSIATSGDGSGASGSSTAMDALLNLVGSVNAGKGKYEEYQSICRANLYDNPANFDSETQQKRIEELKTKIKSEGSTPQDQIKLLKEYIDQNKRIETQQQYANIKAEKSTEQISRLAEALFAFSEGDPNRAESLLSRITIDDPKNVLALTYLAEIYTKNQKYFEAASAYYDLVKLTKASFDLELCEIQILD